MTSTTQSLRVAVIGGGAAGLAAARVLSRQGLKPLVLEQEEQVGGVWSYKANSRTSPMYRGLRTNLPREVMAFREQPWGSGVGNSYVTHQDVLHYLQEYKTEFELDQYIEYGAKVTRLRVLEDQKSAVKLGDEQLPLLELKWQKGTKSHCQTFDAVCVANGHYAKPAFSPVEGLDNFEGRILHSIEYDDPSQFAGQTVLCIGGRASGSDLAREISQHAQKVYLSDTTCQAKEELENIVWVPKTERVTADGSIEFAGDAEGAKNVDTILFCTGYDYEFPFITKDSNLELSFLPGERRVKPLYKQLWHARYPNLCFLGLPHSVVPFPLFELQSEAFVHSILNNNLPSLQERLSAAEQDAEATERIQDTHFLGGAQWEYCQELAQLADNLTDDVANYIATNKVLYDHAGSERKMIFPGGPDTYRSTCYTRDNEKQSIAITASEMEEVVAK